MVMNRVWFGVLSLVLVLSPLGVCAEETNGAAMLSMEPTEVKSTRAGVTAVYGISADDYLPATANMRQQMNPQVRGARSRPSFDLPDAFFFIGAPIFLLLFLRVLVIFFDEFEEKRKEEQRAAVRVVADPDSD